MAINQIWGIYFSPTGGTGTVVKNLTEELGKALSIPWDAFDITHPAAREIEYSFGEGDLVVFGSPVYAGRLPNKIMPDYKRCFFADGASAVPVVTFGNRSWGGALDELSMLLSENGFVVVGGAAVACRHAFTDKVGAGRPDGTDLTELAVFAARLAKKLRTSQGDAAQFREGEALPDAADAQDAAAQSREGAPLPDAGVAQGDAVQPREGEALPDAGTAQDAAADFAPSGEPPRTEEDLPPYYTPLQEDGTPANFLKALPVTDAAKCDHCGICRDACPVGSIDEAMRAAGLCIKCQACVRKCPRQAKYFTDEAFLSHVRMLEQNYTARATNFFRV